MSARSRSPRWLSLTTVAIATSVVVFAGMSAAVADDPPGNNGTIKIAGVDVDAGGNDSHVPCAFAIEFSGYDEGDLSASLTLEAQSPTSGGTLWISSTFIGEDPAGGANDLDAVAPVDLAGAFEEQPHGQGYHVRLTINADGSIGADVKHKTLWVDCEIGGGGEGEGGEGGESGEGGEGEGGEGEGGEG